MTLTEVNFSSVTGRHQAAPPSVKFSTRPMTQVLLIAHPGHELLVYGQMATTDFRVMILTDGSGGAGQSRIGVSHELITRLGGKSCDFFEAHTDAEIYSAILAHDVDFFGALVDRVAAELRSPGVDGLISDAVEYYNPTHDICCAIGQLAVRRVARGGKRLTHRVSPMTVEARSENQSIHVLPPAVAARKKMDVERISGLIHDLTGILEEGSAFFDREFLVTLDPKASLIAPPQGPVFYEAYGRRQLAKKGGGELITFASHVRPLLAALERRETMVALEKLAS